MKLNLIIQILFLVLTTRVASQVPDSVKFKSLDPYDFHLTYLKEDNAMMIDVREFFEYRKLRIKYAVNIPSSGNLQLSSDTLNKESSLFIYCTSGFRSKRVSKFFCDKGFSRVFNLEGGINAWRKDGFPVEHKRVKRQ
jgi:phage shock protein E